MSRAFAAAAVAAIGCTSRVNPEYCRTHPEDETTCGRSDGGADGPSLCLGSGSFAVCVETPNGPVMLATDLDTDIASDCAPAQPAIWKAAGQPDACFVIATSVTVQTLRAHGGRPLVVVASDAITVTGLDVSSTRTSSTVGAGYDQTACGVGTPPVANVNGGGGGAGGSLFGAAGGGGGNGGGGTGGIAAPGATMPPSVLSGGCAGQNGGTGIETGGPGGIGGGAVYLLAASQIDLSNATLNASGAGGSPGGRAAGGGGGGSGGMIVLHASTIGASGATLVANAGGGGGGGAGGPGMPGHDPDPTMVKTAAAGGTGANQGSGGTGFAGDVAAQSGAASGGGGAGGGGGGGGGGYIQSNHALGTTTVSPTPVTM